MYGLPISTNDQALAIPDRSQMVVAAGDEAWTWCADGDDSDPLGDLAGDRLTHIAIPVEDAIAMREDLLEWADEADNAATRGLMLRMANAILPEPLAEAAACPPDWQALLAELVEDGSGFALAKARKALQRWPVR